MHALPILAQQNKAAEKERSDDMKRDRKADMDSDEGEEDEESDDEIRDISRPLPVPKMRQRIAYVMQGVHHPAPKPSCGSSHLFPPQRCLRSPPLLVAPTPPNILALGCFRTQRGQQWQSRPQPHRAPNGVKCCPDAPRPVSLGFHAPSRTQSELFFTHRRSKAVGERVLTLARLRHSNEWFPPVWGQ